MSKSRKITFPWPCLFSFDSVMPTQTSETSSRSQGGGSVMISSSSSAASARVKIAVAIVLQPVNTSEAPRYQLL